MRWITNPSGSQRWHVVSDRAPSVSDQRYVDEGRIRTLCNQWWKEGKHQNCLGHPQETRSADAPDDLICKRCQRALDRLQQEVSAVFGPISITKEVVGVGTFAFGRSGSSPAAIFEASAMDAYDCALLLIADPANCTIVEGSVTCKIRYEVTR